MSDIEITLLKSLALRPSRHVPDNLQPVVRALAEAGYVSEDASGWMATPQGCALVEKERARHSVAAR
jgi:hypothetical protein